MSFVYLANNRLGLRVLEWLISVGQRPTALVIHPGDTAKCRDELIAVSGLDSARIREAEVISTPAGRRWLRGLAPSWLVSVFFGYVLPSQALGIPSKGAINLHTGLLPYNRGAHPNVWSIVERTPAGVTVHYMEPSVDTGDIIAQRPVAVDPTDTAASLYAKLEDAAAVLFRETWPRLIAGTATRRPQPSGGTVHRASDLSRLDRLDPEQLMTVRELIDILRARTFEPHSGAYVDLPTGRVYVRVSLASDPAS